MKRLSVVASVTSSTLAALGLIASCSLFTDLGGLSNGYADSGTGETGADGGDAGIVVDAAGCARFADASFCADFEGPSPTAAPPWTGNELTGRPGGGAIALTTVDPISPPNAVRITAAGGTGGCDYLRLIKRFSGNATAVTTRYRVRAGSEDAHFALGTKASSVLSFSVIVALGRPFTVTMIVQRNDNNTVSPVAQESKNLTTEWPGRWLDVRLELTTQPSPKVALLVDDTRIDVALPAAFSANEPDLSIGGYCFGSDVLLDFDDFATWIYRP